MGFQPVRKIKPTHDPGREIASGFLLDVLHKDITIIDVVNIDHICGRKGHAFRLPADAKRV
jgi:hypothetical protein